MRLAHLESTRKDRHLRKTAHLTCIKYLRLKKKDELSSARDYSVLSTGRAYMKALNFFNTDSGYNIKVKNIHNYQIQFSI